MPSKTEIPSIKQIIDKYNSKNDFTNISPTEVVTDKNELRKKEIDIVPNNVRNIIARFESSEKLVEPTPTRQSKYKPINSINKKDKIDPEIVRSRIQHFSKVNEISSNNYTNNFKPKVFKELLPTSKRNDFTSLRSQFESQQSDYQEENWWEEFTSSELNFSQTSCSPSDLHLRSTQEESPNLNELRPTTKAIFNSFDDATGHKNNVRAQAGYMNNNLYTTENAVIIGYQYLLGRFISDLGISIAENLNDIGGNSLRRIQNNTEARTATPNDEIDFATFEENEFVLKTTQLNVDYADNVFIDSLENTNSQKSTNSDTESNTNYQHFNYSTRGEEVSAKNKNMSKEENETDIDHVSDTITESTDDISNTTANSLEKRKKLSEQESQTDCEYYTETFNNLLKQIQNEVNNYSSLKNKEKLIEQETQTDFEQHIIAECSTEQIESIANDEDCKATYFVHRTPDEIENDNSISEERGLFEKGTPEENIDNPSFGHDAKSIEQEAGTDLEQYAEEFENLVTRIQKEDDNEHILEINSRLFEEEADSDLEQYVEVFDSLIQKVQNHDAEYDDQLFEQTNEIKLEKNIDVNDMIDAKYQHEVEIQDSTTNNNFTQDTKSKPSSKYMQIEAKSVDYLEEIQKITERNIKDFENLFQPNHNNIDVVDDFAKIQELFEQDTESDFKQYESVFNKLVEECQEDVDNAKADDELFAITNELDFESTKAFDNLLKEEKNDIDHLNAKVQLFYKLTDCDSKGIASCNCASSLTGQNKDLLKQGSDVVQHTIVSEENVKLIEHHSESNSDHSTADHQSLEKQIIDKELNQKDRKIVPNREANLEQGEIYDYFVVERQNLPNEENEKDHNSYNLAQKMQKNLDTFNDLTNTKYDDFAQETQKETDNVLSISDKILVKQECQTEFEQVKIALKGILKKGEENRNIPLTNTNTNPDDNDESSSSILEEPIMNKSNNMVKNLRVEHLIKSRGRRWSAGNADLLKTTSKYKKIIEDDYDGKEPRRSSVADIIEEFNNKSTTTTTKPTKNLRLNSTRFRMRRSSSGDTKLSTSNNAKESSDEKSDSDDGEDIKIQIDVEKLTNIFEKRIAENKVTWGKYPKIDALQEKLVHNRQINYAPKILDEVMEVEEGNIKKAIGNDETKNILEDKRIIEETYEGQFDSRNLPNSQAEYQTDQRNVQHTEQEDLIKFYNGFFEKISDPVFAVISVYCLFCLIREISKFLFYIFALPFCI